MGFLCSWVSLRGNPDAAKATTGGRKRPQENFQGSSLNRLRAWSRLGRGGASKDGGQRPGLTVPMSGDSQLSITSAAEDPTPLASELWHCVHYLHADKHTYI